MCSPVQCSVLCVSGVCFWHVQKGAQPLITGHTCPRHRPAFPVVAGGAGGADGTAGRRLRVPRVLQRRHPHLPRGRHLQVCVRVCGAGRPEVMSFVPISACHCWCYWRPTWSPLSFPPRPTSPCLAPLCLQRRPAGRVRSCAGGAPRLPGGLPPRRHLAQPAPLVCSSAVGGHGAGKQQRWLGCSCLPNQRRQPVGLPAPLPTCLVPHCSFPCSWGWCRGAAPASTWVATTANSTPTPVSGWLAG